VTFHLHTLNREFEKRKTKNARYSLRAYAAFLNLHPSALSRVLSNKQLLSPRAGLSVAKKLSLSQEESRRFLQSVVEDRRVRECARLGVAIGTPDLRPQPIHIPEEVYRSIATVQCLSILELTMVEGFSSDPVWIANQLGCSVDEAKRSIELLLSVKMLKRIDGKLVNDEEHLTAIDSKDTNEVRLKFQEEVLGRAISALKQPFESRVHLGMTMAIDPLKINEARDRILKFIETLSDDLETGRRTHVYHLGVQLFSLTAGSFPPGKLDH
jgi:uncharacterized protein (TIGR02147 family)